MMTGVKLTAPGRSIYEDAKAIIRLSEEAKQKAAASEKEVRIGTSTLFKCRMLPDLWMKTAKACEGLDIREGVFPDTGHKDSCRFPELNRTTLCCGVPKGNALAGKEKITLADLDGEFIVIPIAGISEGLDTLRGQIADSGYNITIIDSMYYGADTFTLCEVNNYILILQEVHRDIVTNPEMIPPESNITLPYGLMYVKEPTPAVVRFIQAVKEIMPR